MFSYGSGLASAMFVIRVNSDPSFMRPILNIKNRLASRLKFEAKEYDRLMEERRLKFNKKSQTPKVSQN
jgi:3-hydroxy-3-methylglutaryl CoA synthase